MQNNYKNLWTEIESVLRDNRKCPKDIYFITNGRESVSWQNFKAQAERINYNPDYVNFSVRLVPENLRVVGKDWWLERKSRNLPRWVFCTLPSRPKEETKRLLSVQKGFEEYGFFIDWDALKPEDIEGYDECLEGFCSHSLKRSISPKKQWRVSVNDSYCGATLLKRGDPLDGKSFIVLGQIADGYFYLEGDNIREDYSYPVLGYQDWPDCFENKDEKVYLNGKLFSRKLCFGNVILGTSYFFANSISELVDALSYVKVRVFNTSELHK